MFTNHATGSRHPASCLKQVVCPALELLTFNAIIFDVAAPVSAALLFLSLLLVIDPMQLQDVSFSPSCMQIRTAYKIQKYWGQNLALLSCMQETFVLFLEFGHATSYFIKQITNEMNTMNTLLPNAKESQFWLKMQPVPSDKKNLKQVRL